MQLCRWSWPGDHALTAQAVGLQLLFRLMATDEPDAWPSHRAPGRDDEETMLEFVPR